MNTSTATEIIARFEDAENGIAAEVARIATGYSVTLVDTDAGEAVDTVRIYPTEAAAVAYARTLTPSEED